MKQAAPNNAVVDPIAEQFAQAIESIDFGETATNAHLSGIDQERVALGLSPVKRAPDDFVEKPDVPSCDACGKSQSGHLICGRCQLAFYCSKDCQIAAWKSQGHKAECSGMKEESQRVAKEVVTVMADTTLSAVARVQGLEQLDSEGPYREAKKVGLNQVIQALMVEDMEHVQKRFTSGDYMERTAFCSSVSCTLFRGGRISRRGVATTRSIDESRVRSYVRSSPDAFCCWLEASLIFVMVPMDRKIFKNKPLHAQLHQSARDILASWNQVFTNERVSKAILFGKDKVAGKKGVERVKFIASKIKWALNGLKEQMDTHDVLEGLLNQLLAMVAFWCQKFQIPLNMPTLVGLRGLKLQMYQQMAVPLGEATIQKGFALNNQEAQAAMQRARR